MIIKDGSQNFWQLASIAGMALGFPAMVIGGQLAKQYGPETALTSVVIGNFILWLIGLAMVSMAQNRIHAIGNIREYLGEITAGIAAVLWVCIFLIWYILQINGVSGAVANFFQIQDQWRIGAGLGFFITVLGLGGIRLIKWFCVISLPFLVFFVIYVTLFSKYTVQFSGTWGVSVPAILSIVLIWLPFGVNLPTFFRYSRSQSDSILGLSLMTIFHMVFQIFTIIIGVQDSIGIIYKYSLPNMSIDNFMVIAFILSSYCCVNLLNIYFASVAWETIIPQHRGSKEYLVIGLLGTSLYIFLYKYPVYHFYNSIQFLADILVSFIVSLVFVLLISFLMKIVIKHRLRFLEKLWNSLCWLLGCIAAIIVQIRGDAGLNSGVIAGLIFSGLGFLTVIFIEETIWSIKKLRLKPD